MSKQRKRVGNVEKEKRVFTIQGWIIDGVPEYLIKKQVYNWGLSGRQVQRYMKEAYDRWKKDQEIDVKSRRDSRIAELQNDIRNMDEKFKKTPAGLRIMLSYKKELSKLEDLYPAKQIRLSGDADNPVRVKSETLSPEMEEKFKEFLKKEYKFK